MPSGVAQRALAVVQAPLPDLMVGNHHTTRSALHPERFVGVLRPWPNFENDVESFSRGIYWARYTHVLTYKGKTPQLWNLNQEQTEARDEIAMQGKFRRYLGDPVTATCRVLGKYSQITDHKATSTATINGLTPDFAITKAGNAVAAVGEAKVCWVKEHRLGLAVMSSKSLKRVLGQVALYMQTYKVKYGFQTTYDETIFLKQESTSSGWVLYYSDPIQHDAIGDRSKGTVSLRECFLYLVDESLNSPVANNDEQNWVVSSEID